MNAKQYLKGLPRFMKKPLSKSDRKYKITNTVVLPCAVFDIDGKFCIDAEADQADIYSVYLRLDIPPEVDNNFRSIADFKTLEEARKFEILICNLFNLKAQ